MNSMRYLSVRILLLFIFPIFGLSCRAQSVTLKEIAQQRSGDYLVTLLNDTGAVKQNANTLTLEFRNASTKEMVDVKNVKLQASMRMPGMGPMFGNVSATRQVGPGRYNFDADVSMAGQWSFVVTFEPGGRAQFNLNAQ